MGLLVALTPGCQKKCGPENCAGCCTDKAECVGTTTDAQCGSAGQMCSACGTDQACTDNACVNKTVDPVDSGVPDAGPPPCTSDFDCSAGLICDGMGKCVTGQSCTQNYECQELNDPDDRCYRYGIGCLCDTRQDDGGIGNGVCRVRKTPCTECKSDVECGTDPNIFGAPDGVGTGRCRALPDDMSGKKYCRYQQIGQCQCGNINDGEGYCVPQTNSCDSIGCNLDGDCPSGAICTVNRPDAGANSCGGVCKPRCRWDFNEKANVAPGCPPNETCWVDQRNLDPNSLYYGAGRCKPACAGDSECQLSAGNPFGGPDLVCKTEKLLDGTESAKRCRARGECMDSQECPELTEADAGPYLGYCDRGTFACKRDCRPGVDPVTALPYKDCRNPFACTADAGINYCRLETCKEQGGALVACARGEYCCGDDKNFDNIQDACPATGQNAAGCYKAPTPPFCTLCGQGADLNDPMAAAAADAECLALMPPSYVTCANGSRMPNCSPLAPKCVYAGDKMQQGDGVNVCAMPTINDIGTVPLRYGDTRKDTIACPVGYIARDVRPQPNPSQEVGYCQTNADCAPRQNDGGFDPDGGFCEIDQSLKTPDGGFYKACRCEPGTLGTQCPNGEGFPTGKQSSFCKAALNGTRSYCVETVLCGAQNTQVYYAPADNFGCGL